NDMLPFKLIYGDGYFLPIGAHVFPAEKYKLIKERLLATRVAEPSDILEPKPAGDDDIRLAHTEDYVRKLTTGTLSAAEAALLQSFRQAAPRVTICRRRCRAMPSLASRMIRFLRSRCTSRITIPPSSRHLRLM